MRRLLHLLLVPAVVFIVACLDRQLQTDFWVHLARGQLILERGHLLTIDPFCFASEPARLVDANWLSQVIFARLFSWGGLNLVQAVNAGILSLTFALIYSLCRKGDQRAGSSMTPTPACAGACVLVFFGIWQTILIRPQTFSFLLFVLLYALLCKGGKRALLIGAPLIMALWCNLHGGYAIGLVLLGAFAITERIESLLAAKDLKPIQPRSDRWAFTLALALGTLATLLNPFGWRIYTYAIGVAGRASARHIEEWLPPSLGQFIGIILLLTVLLVAFGIVQERRSSKRLPIRQLVLMICFLPLAFRSARMAPWWFLVAAPMLARWLATLPAISSEAISSQSTRSRTLAGAICGLLLLACVMSLPSLEAYNPLFGSVRSPHRTESDLQTLAARSIGPQGRVYAPLEWSQYLDFALGAHRRLLVDGHIEAFSDPVWTHYCRITAGDSMWEQTADHYQFRYLLLDRATQHSLIQRVSRSPQWTQRDAAGTAVLYVRSEMLPDTASLASELSDTR